MANAYVAEAAATLQKLRYEIVAGKSTETVESSVEVLALVSSASRAEFYAAAKSGYTVDLICELWALEYHGEERVIIDDVAYDVVRSYRKDMDKLELTLRRHAAK